MILRHGVREVQYLHKEVIIILLNKWLTMNELFITNSWSLFPNILKLYAYVFVYFSVEGPELSSVSQKRSMTYQKGLPCLLRH